MSNKVNYTINFCEDLKEECKNKDPSQMQGIKDNGECTRLAGSVVKNNNNFNYLGK
jgi:hypothetical protein